MLWMLVTLSSPFAKISRKFYLSFQERNKFRSSFNQFADMNRLPIADRCITWNGSKLDMYQFYSAVKKAGGFRQVCLCPS